MSEQQEPKKTSETPQPSSFLNKVFEAVSDDKNEVKKPVIEAEKNDQKSSMIQGFLRGLMTKRSIVAILITAVFLFLSIVIYVVINPGYARYIRDIFGIDYAQIRLILQNIIYYFFGGIVFISGSIFAFLVYRSISLQTKELKKKIVVWFSALISMTIFFLLLGAFLYVYAQFQKLNFSNLTREVLLYNNDLYLYYPEDEKAKAQMSNTSDIYGPVTIRYDLSDYIDKIKETQGVSSSRNYRVEIDFDNDGISDIVTDSDIERTINDPQAPLIILSITSAGQITPTGTLIGTSVTQEQLEIPLVFPIVTVKDIIDISESYNDLGGLKIRLDGKGLEQFGDMRWYLDSSETSEYETGSVYAPKDAFYDSEAICLDFVQSSDQEGISCDWVYVIRGVEGQNILGSITTTSDPINPQLHRVEIVDLEATNGDIDVINWFLDDGRAYSDTFSGAKQIIDLEILSPGSHIVEARVRDTLGNERVFSINVDVQEQVFLKEGFTIQVIDDQGNNLAEESYDSLTNTYIIDNVSAPTTLELDATRIRAESSRISGPPILVSWDMDNDGVFEITGDTQELMLNTSKVQDISVRYDFEDTSIVGQKEILQKVERVSIIAIKKDIDACMKVTPRSIYAPTIVTVDTTCSRSDIGEIRVFSYDFGVGEGEVEGEGIKRFQYTEPGEYLISVTAISVTGERDTQVQKLVLKVPQVFTEINTSLPSTRISAGQSVTFDALQTQGDVDEFVWDFGDNKPVKKGIRVDYTFANPGTYTVTLTAYFETGDIDIQEKQITVRE